MTDISVVMGLTEWAEPQTGEFEIHSQSTSATLLKIDSNFIIAQVRKKYTVWKLKPSI